MNEFTHFDEGGASRMVDVGEKEITRREARASARVRMKPETLAAIRGQSVRKGDVLCVARLAGIMAAKKTGDFIPLCHPLPIELAEIAFEFPDEETILVIATVGITARTGVEMKALVAASTAALTIYDMCKSLDRAMVVERLQLEENLADAAVTFGENRSVSPTYRTTFTTIDNIRMTLYLSKEWNIDA